MQPHEARIIVERDELALKLDKLYTFMDTEMFSSLDARQRKLLDSQCFYMTGYLGILDARINLFKE